MLNFCTKKFYASSAGDFSGFTTLASLAEEASLKRVNFQLSADQHMKLKIYAARQGKTIKELLTEYVASLPE